jgi:hypothetical protein
MKYQKYKLDYNRTLWSLVRIKEGVKVYGSRHPMSKRTWDILVAKIREGRQTSGVHQPWGREMEEVRHLEPGGIRD